MARSKDMLIQFKKTRTIWLLRSKYKFKMWSQAYIITLQFVVNEQYYTLSYIKIGPSSVSNSPLHTCKQRVQGP
jgi:hypothetical protein